MLVNRSAHGIDGRHAHHVTISFTVTAQMAHFEKSQVRRLELPEIQKHGKKFQITARNRKMTVSRSE
jgi:hypothetical protein